jgi:O-antigen/teichoic acid export membrane protein
MKLGAGLSRPRRGPVGFVGHLGRRYGWGLADQIFSSVTNFALGILVAHFVSLSKLGVFSLAFAAYLVALGFARAIASEPLTVRHSGSDRTDWLHATRRATGAALATGLSFSCICLIAALLAPEGLDRSLAMLGLVMPGLLLQDCWRFAFFAGNQSGKALANDLVWAGALFPTLGVLFVGDPPEVWAIILAWGGAATLAALVGSLQCSVAPRVSGTISWLRQNRRLIAPFLAEFAMGYGAGQAILFAAGAISLEAAGTLRAGQLLLGPYFVLLMGTRIAVLPEAVRIAENSAALRRMTILVAIFLGGAAIAWGTFIRLLPDSVGETLLGAAWDPGRNVVLALAFASAAAGLILGGEVGLRSVVAIKRSLRSRVVTGILVLLGGIGGVLLHGAFGAAVGTALATWVAAGWWWSEFLSSQRQVTQSSVPRI